MKINKNGFTMVELMVSTTIFTSVLVRSVAAIMNITSIKPKLEITTSMQKNALYFTEKLYEEIKRWWVLDFEEYFNRQVIGTWVSNSWYYTKPSNFWNVTDLNNPFYFCHSSWSTTSNYTSSITSTWCVKNNNISTSWLINKDYSWSGQTYGQYALQFIDYNWDSDLSGDTNADWSVFGDDDDVVLWDWPEVFELWKNVYELYLISPDWKERTLFRHKVKQDPMSKYTCNPSWSQFEWCFWSVQFLKLTWEDWWYDHSWSTSWTWDLDWRVDTWNINTKFSVQNNVLASNWATDFRQDLFSDYVNVKKFEIYPFPNKDYSKAWSKADLNIHPYVKIKLILLPAAIKKWNYKWKIPEINIIRTINLSNISIK